LKSKFYELAYGLSYEWAALANRYFVISLISFDRNNPKRPDFSIENRNYTVRLQEKMPETMSPGSVKKFRFFVYAGPKDRDIFRAYKKKYSDVYGLISLEQAMGFSRTIGPISNFLLDILDFIHRIIPNFGVAIIILTILIKVIFSPLTYKQYESMAKMKKLQPHINNLKEQFKNDPQKLNAETMSLYKKHKINPLSGCFPILIQIPVFFAFYDLLAKSIKLRDSHFLWIKDLANPDTVGMVAGIPINVLPLLMGLTMFIQQKTSSSVGDSQQQKIMMFLPFVFLFIFWNLPSGLVLYWTAQNILSIAEQLIINNRIKKKEAKSTQG
jgi:YidC/Oxa1 family membrane protein insertase